VLNQNNSSSSDSYAKTAVEQILEGYNADPRIYSILFRDGIKRFTHVQQFAIISGLFEGKNLIICAATSAGKTLVGELACINAILGKKRRCLYMVPLKSLANEKWHSFQRRWIELGVEVAMSTGDMDLLDRQAEEEKLKTTDLLITTYERADSILRSYPEWYTNVEVIVIDEIHNIGIERRGARLEGLLLRLIEHFPHIQLIGLSATIDNPEELAEWLQAELIEHTHRPVPLEYQIELVSSRNRRIKEIVNNTLRDRGSILIFIPTRWEAEQLARDIDEYLRDHELLYLINGRELRALVNDLHDQIGTQFDKRLFYSIPHGVAFHHAGLSRIMREFIESLFRQGLVKIIVCTPTLSSGVNLPAKVVVIKDVGLTRGYLKLDPNSLHQMCGRAGRPQFDTKGIAIILAQERGEKSEILLTYFQGHSLTPQYAPVESQFIEVEPFLEQILLWIYESPVGLHERDLQEFVLKTYWYFFHRRRSPDITVDHLIRIGYYSLENLLIRHSTPSTIEQARAIPDSAVNIRLMQPFKLEGIINDRTWIKACFSQEHPDCGCTEFDSRHAHEAKLCRHLVKLAQVAYKHHPSYTREILFHSLQEDHLIDRLLKYRMIKIVNSRFCITEFGRLTVILYLQPKTAFWIRQHLPSIQTREKFYRSLLYAYNLERYLRNRGQFHQVLVHLLEDEYEDFNYHMGKLGEEYRISPGDMEEFIETLRWMIYSFHSLAEQAGANTVLHFTEVALDRLSMNLGDASD